MSRSSTAFRSVIALAVLLPSALFALAADKKAEKAAPKPAEPTTLRATGALVDCTDYLLLGKTPEDHRDIQVKNMTSGMPACFIDGADGTVYLLVNLAGHAKDLIQPIESFIGEGLVVDGVVYQKGSLKALAISSFNRSGTYEDRQTRRKDNMTATRHQKKDPKATPSPADPTPGAVSP